MTGGGGSGGILRRNLAYRNAHLPSTWRALGDIVDHKFLLGMSLLIRPGSHERRPQAGRKAVPGCRYLPGGCEARATWSRHAPKTYRMRSKVDRPTSSASTSSHRRGRCQRMMAVASLKVRGPSWTIISPTIGYKVPSVIVPNGRGKKEPTAKPTAREIKVAAQPITGRTTSTPPPNCSAKHFRRFPIACRI